MRGSTDKAKQGGQTVKLVTWGSGNFTHERKTYLCVAKRRQPDADVDAGVAKFLATKPVEDSYGRTLSAAGQRREVDDWERGNRAFFGSDGAGGARVVRLASCKSGLALEARPTMYTGPGLLLTSSARVNFCLLPTKATF